MSMGSDSVVPTPILLYINTPKYSKKSRMSEKMYSVPLSSKPWSSPENTDQNHAVFKQSPKQKRYSLKGMKMVLQACGLLRIKSTPTPKVEKVDASTQTDDIPQYSPACVVNKNENIYRTPKRNNKETPKIFAPITPSRNIQLMLEQIQLQHESRDQQLYNPLPPQSKLLNICNNFKTNVNLSPKVSPSIFDNVTPVSTKNWRVNNGPQSNRASPKPSSRFNKVVRKTRAMHKKYATATVKLLKNAYNWFKNITKFTDEVDKVGMTNVNQVLNNEVTKTEQMFLLIRKEIEELKGMITDLKYVPQSKPEKTESTPILTITPSIPVPPPPPVPSVMVAPPPPPPPPMPMLKEPSNTLPKVIKRNSQDKPKVVEQRPSISLEDILKVKLRKPCERSQTLPKSTPRSGPVVTMDDLKNVRLKKVSSSLSLQLPKSNPNVSVSNSPVSSLKRLLTTGPTSESRAKRMRHKFATNSRSNMIDREFH